MLVPSILSVLPDDPILPLVRAGRTGALEEALGEAGIGPIAGARLLSHHHGSRCTLLVEVDERRLAVKAYLDHPSEQISLARRFAEAGLAGADAPKAPALVAAVPSLALVAVEWLEGPSGTELLARGDGTRAGEVAAAWLHALAERDLRAGNRYDPESLLADADGWAARIAAAEGSLAPASLKLRRSLERDLPQPRGYRLCHGSFTARHVLDLGAGPGVIDWDGFRLGPIELDAGMFLAALARASGRRSLAAEAQRADARFRSAIESLTDADTLSWYERASALRLASYLVRRRPHRWLERVRALLGP